MGPEEVTCSNSHMEIGSGDQAADSPVPRLASPRDWRLGLSAQEAAAIAALLGLVLYGIGYYAYEAFYAVFGLAVGLFLVAVLSGIMLAQLDQVLEWALRGVARLRELHWSERVLIVIRWLGVVAMAALGSTVVAATAWPFPPDDSVASWSVIGTFIALMVLFNYALDYRTLRRFVPVLTVSMLLVAAGLNFADRAAQSAAEFRDRCRTGISRLDWLGLRPRPAMVVWLADQSQAFGTAGPHIVAPQRLRSDFRGVRLRCAQDSVGAGDRSDGDVCPMSWVRTCRSSPIGPSGNTSTLAWVTASIGTVA